MPNWERTPPVSGMSVEEIKARVADGIKNRRKAGELRPEGLGNVMLEPDGPHFTKAQRVRVIQASNLAIYALANGDREDYCEAVNLIDLVRIAAGFDSSLMQALCKGIAEVAAEASGDPFEVLDQLARSWLRDYFRTSGRIISIATGVPEQ